MIKRTIAMLSLALLVAGCVSKDRYDLATKSATDAQLDAQTCHSADARDKAALAKLGADYKTAYDLTTSQSKKLDDAMKKSGDLQARLDEFTAQNAELRKALEKLGKDADKLLGEKGTLASALTDARARLEELRKAQAATDARVALFRQLAMKLHKMVDSGALSIVLRDGRMVIRLPNDVLFDSGQTDLKPAGQNALKMLATALKTLPDRHFQIAGHTDNVPIATARFPSNWELSNARAVQVVHFLIGQGMRPEVLAAAGYGEFDPVAPNDTSADRGKNRRIEITLQPNIDELVAVPDVK